MNDRYILDEHGNPRPEPDLMTWGHWLQNADRTVKREEIGDAVISTVFLGLDHSFDDGPPILWETMVFGGPHDQDQDRCSGNREQAEAMHERMLAKVRDQ